MPIGIYLKGKIVYPGHIRQVLHTFTKLIYRLFHGLSMGFRYFFTLQGQLSRHNPLVC